MPAKSQRKQNEEKREEKEEEEEENKNYGGDLHYDFGFDCVFKD